jgi:hypothetical protein
VYPLPDAPGACTMGTEGDLRLVDATGTVSRTHAQAEPVEVDGVRIWTLRDLRSKNGLRLDGRRCESCFLQPGTEVRLGSLRLVAESERLMGLFAWLRRILGWALERQAHVDQMARCLREWAAERAELVVVGDGDLVPEVRRLHRLVIGESVSLMCEPNGGDAAAVVRAVRTAVDGTLCVQVNRRVDARMVVERWRERELGVRPRLVFCTAELAVASTILKELGGQIVMIRVPPLASRVGEREALVQAYVGEAAHELELSEPGLTLHDMERLRALPFPNLAEIEETALRLVTLRTWGVVAGAARLGLDEDSLRSWAGLRGLSL